MTSLLPHWHLATTKRLVNGLSLVPILVLVLAAEGLAQAAPQPTPSAAGSCPAVVRYDYDVSSIPDADRIRWQLWRGAPGQPFEAATKVDDGGESGTTGSVQKNLRRFGPVLDGTRYFFLLRARQGDDNLTDFSTPVIFELDLSSNGMFTASAGASPGSLRLDWNLRDEIGACADRVAVRIDKVGGATPVQSVEPGVSGSRTFDLTAQGAGDYDVRIHARHDGDTAEDAVGRESAPVPPVAVAVLGGPDISIDDLSFPEGIADNTQNAVVRLSAPTKQTVTVLVGARPGGSATEGACTAGRDVTFALRTVTINTGQPQVTVPFTVCGDNLQEPDESFTLGLTAPVNATLRDSIGQVTIRNDDATPPPAPPAPLNVSIRDAPFTEGNSNSTQLVVVRLSAFSNQPVTVLIGARPGGTATEGSCAAGRDFTFAFRSVTINPGFTEVDAPFTLCGDTVFENDETFSLGLTSAVNAALIDSVATMTVRNDDPAPAEGPIAPSPALPNLQVVIDESPQFETQLGPLLSHELTVRNTGAGPASNVLVQSTLPKGVRFLRVEANEFSGCTGIATDVATGQALVRCTVASLPAGANKSVRIVGEVAGVISDSTRVVFGVNVDPERIVRETSESDNFAFLSTIVRLHSDLEVTVKGIVTGGERGVAYEGTVFCPRRETTVTVSLTVRNLGPYGSRATTISAAWPDGFQSAGGCFDTCLLPAQGPPALDPPGGIGGGVSVNVSFRAAIVDTGLLGPLRSTFTVDPAGTLLDPILANNTVTTVVCD